MNSAPSNRVVLLTPEGRGAVATVLVDGPQATEIVSRHLFDNSGGPLPLESRQRWAALS